MPTSSGGLRLRLLLAGLLLLAAVPRLWRLDDVPVGLGVDEAYEGLQAGALRRGETLPEASGIPFPRWPVWCALEATATAVGGDAIGVLRIPAAVAGVAGVALAFMAGRAVTGSAVAGLASAAWLAGSFWHVQYSRLALPCVLTVAEGLAMAWLLLAPRLPGPAGGAALAALCLLSLYGYAGGVVTPVAAGVILLLRWNERAADRSGRGLRMALALGVVVIAATVSLHPPESLRRSAQVAGRHGAGWAQRAPGWAASFVRPPAAAGFWSHYPPGAPRLSLIELALVLAGVLVLTAGGGLAARVRLGWAGWMAVSVIPELSGDQVPHLIRGLPQLAPLAVAAGLGVMWLTTLHRSGPKFVALVLAVNLALTGRTLVRFASDPVTATWFLQPDRAAGEWIAAQSRLTPIALAPAFEYGRTPVMRFHLDAALRAGTVTLRPDGPVRPRRVAEFRDPVTGRPVSVILEGAPTPDGRRHLRLAYVQELTGTPPTR